MFIFKLIYVIFKSVLYDRIGTIWNNKKLISIKGRINNQCLNFFQKHKDSTYDEFIVDFSPILWAIVAFAFIQFGILHWFAINKSHYLFKEMAFTIVFAVYFIVYGFISKNRLISILKEFLGKIAKILKTIGLIIGFLLFVIYAFINYANSELNTDISFITIYGYIKEMDLSWIFYLAAVPIAIVLVLILFVFIPFLAARIFTFLFKKTIINPTLKRTPNEPLKIISWIIADIFIIESTCIIFYELFTV